MTLREAAEQMTTLESVRNTSSCGCITPDYPSDDELNPVIDAVSNVMARLSGMRERGRAAYIARPCRSSASCIVACPCCGLDAIPIGEQDPVVSEVWINGFQLEESEYALHSSLTGWNLVRLRSADDLTSNRRPRDWPSWQDRWRDYTSTTDTPTFAVIFTSGAYVDDIFIERAANELVCDVLTEELNVQNQLPDGTISADLGGVRVSLSSDRISAITERLQRIAAGQLGPAFTRFMGFFAPLGRMTPIAWAPELLGGWDLNLAWYVAPEVSDSVSIMAPTVTATGDSA